MLQSLIDVAKVSLRPSSVFACVLLVLVGVALLYLKREKLARRWLIGVAVVYWLISTPFGSALLSRGLSHGYSSLQSPSDVPRGSAIVLLSGGSNTFRADGGRLDAVPDSSAFRVLEAARLYRLLGEPIIVVSGGAVFPEKNPIPEAETLGRLLIELGVAPDHLVYESKSRTTRDQVAMVKTILDARHIDNFVLVTSPAHMRRSMALFKAAGLKPYPSVSRLISDDSRSEPSLVPTERHLSLSDDAIYEYLALGYYWARGRL